MSSLQSSFSTSTLSGASTSSQQSLAGPSTPVEVSTLSMDLGRNPQQYEYSPEHIQCLCEALQQRGDIEKLASFLRSLPEFELLRSNESVLR